MLGHIIDGISFMLGVITAYRRSEAFITLCVATVCVIPTAALPSVLGIDYFAPNFGSTPVVHPVTWMVLGGVLGYTFGVAWVRAEMGPVYVPRKAVFLFLLFVVLAGLSLATGPQGSSGLSQALDQVVGPISLATILVAIVRRRGSTRHVRAFVLCIATVESVLMVVQSITQSYLVYPTAYASVGALDQNSGSQFRALGTFDHPLSAALFLVIAVCVIDVGGASGRQLAISIALATLFVAAIAASGGRTALLAAAAIILSEVALGSRASVGRRFTSILLIGGGGLIAASFGAFDLVGSRFSSDLGSTDTRLDAYRYFGRTWTAYVVHGEGIGQSFANSQAFFGGYTSFENPFIMTAIDLGMPATVALIAVILTLVPWPRANHIEASWIGVAKSTCIVLCIATYSSFAVRGTSGYFLWIGLGVIYAKSSVDAVPSAEAPQDTERRSTLRS